MDLSLLITLSYYQLAFTTLQYEQPYNLCFIGESYSPESCGKGSLPSSSVVV